MKVEQFLKALQDADKIKDVEHALSTFETAHGEEIQWVPVGGKDKENNSGIINVATDPGRSLVERVTNAVDGVLEREHEEHAGRPECRSPREAATAWLGIPLDGLSTLTTRQRQTYADNIIIRITPGEGDKRTDARTVEVRDRGIGITPEKMPDTILSLNASNKWKKHYLAGTFGQGGSSTFASSKYSVIASRYGEHPFVGFTVVKYLNLPPEEYKTGHYVYLTLNGGLLQCELPLDVFPSGTSVKHFGYDLSTYSGSFGPSSVYGLLQQMIFDPILPIWLEDRVHEYRRVIKGSRNGLRGAQDEGDEKTRGQKVVHHAPTFYVELGEFGRIGMEYWVLEPGTKENRKPSASFVNPAKPIILTKNGQNQAEMTNYLIRKDAELPHLALRLICHVDCDRLSPEATRLIFASTREEARRGLVYSLIQQEIVNNFRSDDELKRLNEEARRHDADNADQGAVQSMRKEIARLLRLQGLNVGETGGVGLGEGGSEKPPKPPRPPRPPKPIIPIPPQEPPTYIHIVADDTEPITFYATQRRYIRIETDASSHYHDPNAKTSNVNIIISNDLLGRKGTTPLLGGRMRAIIEASEKANVAESGTIRVELTRPGLPTLSDEKPFKIVSVPPAKLADGKLTLPPFRFVEVNGPDDSQWVTLDWPTDIDTVASSAEMENGEMVIYYSTVFPRFAATRAALEARDTTIAASFIERYKIWLAVHSFLLNRDEEHDSDQLESQSDDAMTQNDTRRRLERCRVATLSALFAAREVSQLGQSSLDDSES